MRQRLAIFLLLSFFAAAAAQAQQREYIIVVGGPSLHIWEQYKGPIAHDHWWANFVHSARVRTEQLRAQLGPDAMITWLVYKPGYVDRGKQEKQDLIANINSVRDKFHLNLVYFDRGGDVINYLNNGRPREQIKISGFEFFGHSNKACFLFDYSNVVDSASKAWMHETESEENRSARLYARRLREKLGLPHRREHEQTVARCDRHEDVGRDRQDRLLDRRAARALVGRWQMGLLGSSPGTTASSGIVSDWE